MQLAPVATTSSLAHAAPVAPTAAPATPRTAPAPSVAAPASPASPLAIEGAVDGVARLANPPLVDFPGVQAGDQFDIVKGSTTDKFGGIKGDASISRFDADHASFAVSAGKFGFRVEVQVDIERIAADQVRITSKGKGIPDQSAIGRIVESTLNHAVFEQLDDPTKRTVINRDASGRIVIDTIVPQAGATHLILEPR